MAKQENTKDTRFKVGQKKPANSGKKVGTKNKKTQQWELFAEYMLGGGLIEFRKDMKKLTPWQRVRAKESLMDFFKPRLSRVEYQDETKESGITIQEYAQQMAELKNLVEKNYERNKKEGLC